MKKWTDEVIEEAQRSYLDGVSIRELSRKYGCSHTTMTQTLRKWGILIRKPEGFQPSRIYRVNDSAFSSQSPERDYWVGFLFADAHIKDERVLQLQLALKDINHLRKLQVFLDTDRPIHRSSNSKRTYAALHITSAPICADLRRLGMNSLLSEPAEELKSSPDFWRGVVDGDGWVSLYERTKITKTGVQSYTQAAFGLCGGEPLLKHFQNFVKEVCPEYKGNLTPKNKIVALAITGKKAKKVVKSLYGSSSVYLDRKYESAQKIISE